MNPVETYVSVGRRKKAVARVRLEKGAGKINVNGKNFMQYFPGEVLQGAVLKPFKTTEQANKFDARVRVRGGGLQGQAEAIAHGVSRALERFNKDLRGSLKQAGLLRRDPRCRERKKPGRPGARKRFQFSKR